MANARAMRYLFAMKAKGKLDTSREKKKSPSQYPKLPPMKKPGAAK